MEKLVIIWKQLIKNKKTKNCLTGLDINIVCFEKLPFC